jgi:hypothetical protein
MSALGGVYAALKTLIATDATTAALIASAPFPGLGVSGKAVYDDGAAPQPTQVVPMSSLTPYVTIGAGTAIQASGFRARGWNCTVQVKVTAQGSEATGQEIVRMLSALLLPNAPRYLTVTGFTSSWVEDFTPQPTLVTVIGAVVTREWPIIVRVYAT